MKVSLLRFAGAGALACAPLLFACVDDDTVAALPVDAGTDVTVIDAAPTPVDAGGVHFQSCPGAFSGACATLDVPLDWNDPGGTKIHLFIDKIASVAHPRAQIWVLQGGPGGTAADVVPIGREMANRLDDVEVFTIEHRGVGYSDRLGCPQESLPPPDGGTTDAGNAGLDASNDATVDAGLVDASPSAPLDYTDCIAALKAKWGDGLRHFNITNAAKDLAYAIDQTRHPGEQALVYGVSYGTYWAQRYLQVSKGQAAGVVLDSVVAPDKQFLSQFDPQADTVAVKLAELCKSDAACTAALGADPWARIEQIKADVDHGHCAAALPNPRARALATNLIRNWTLMPYALAVWARIGRCSAADVAAIGQIVSRLSAPPPTASLGSDLLGWNIMFSEMWETPAPSKATLDERFADTIFPAGIDALADVYDAWPRYTPDDLTQKYPTDATPVLILNGTLDSQTPIEVASQVKPHYTAANQTFVTIPGANHATVAQSPLAHTGPVTGPPNPFDTCGMEMVAGFFKDPKAAIDTSCLAKLAPVSFTRPSDEIAFLFGTSDLWLGVRVPDVPMPAHLEAAMRLRPVYDDRRWQRR